MNRVNTMTGTRTVMLWVIAALLPALATSSWWFGGKVLLHAMVSVVVALTTEFICLTLRRADTHTMTDGSAVVTALLIALAIPPATSLGITACAAAFAIGLGKHAYGGLGQNPFNPAMVGYAIVLVSFPAELSTWPTSISATSTASKSTSAIQDWTTTAAQMPASPESTDTLTGATLLDVMKHDHGRTLAELANDPAFGVYGAWGFEWVALAALAGGLVLLYKGFAAWRVSIGILLSTGLLAVVMHDGGSSNSLGTPLQQWLSGGLILAAFFVATDPVSHPRSATAQWCYAAIIGSMIMAIRGHGNYPDGIAFAILLGNACTPWLDRRWP